MFVLFVFKEREISQPAWLEGKCIFLVRRGKGRKWALKCQRITCTMSQVGRGHCCALLGRTTEGGRVSN